MQKIYGAWLACMLLSVFAFGQNSVPTQESNQEYKRGAAIGVYFFLNDFKTASAIRNGFFLPNTSTFTRVSPFLV